jgi:nitrogen fixation protein NifB
MTVKVNTVLIPGVNDHHVGAVAQRVAGAGAQLINVIALIPQHGFAHLAEPDAAMLLRARAAAQRHPRVFTHCQRCRADACGIPGISDHSAELYGDGRSAATTFSHG